MIMDARGGGCVSLTQGLEDLPARHIAVVYLARVPILRALATGAACLAVLGALDL